MRVSKEFKETLFEKLCEYKLKAKKKYTCSYKEKMINDLRESYTFKLNEFKVKCAEEVINEIEKTYNHKFKEENLINIKEALVKEYYYSLPAFCSSEKEENEYRVLIDKIDEEAKKEKQNLILKLPFLKKEEELKEYMKGIEERLNAL